MTTTIDDGVAVIRLDDGKANALGHDALDGLEAALDTAEADARAAVLVGRDGKFSAGFDLSVMTAGPEQARDLLGRGAELGLRVFEFPIPVVLGVTGHALAMGGILLCCADVRIGAQGPRFAVELCRNALSKRGFNRAIQLAHVHSPDEALEAGFLDEVTDPSQVERRAIEVAAELAEALHPAPFRLTRRNCRGELAESLRQSLADDLAEFNVGN